MADVPRIRERLGALPSYEGARSVARSWGCFGARWAGWAMHVRIFDSGEPQDSCSHGTRDAGVTGLWPVSSSLVRAVTTGLQLDDRGGHGPRGTPHRGVLARRELGSLEFWSHHA